MVTVNAAPKRRLCYDADEAGEHISLSRGMILKLIRNKQLRAKKIGRSLRIEHAELERFLATREVK